MNTLVKIAIISGISWIICIIGIIIWANATIENTDNTFILIIIINYHQRYGEYQY